MKRLIPLVLFVFCISFTAFGGGEAETGRGTAAETVSQGQLLPVGAIDPGNYLSDFECDIKNDGNEPMILRAELMRSRTWERGGLSSFRITLAINEESYFRPTPGLFVIFVQNPELFRDSDFVSGLSEIVSRSSGQDIRIFDAVTKTLRPATTRTQVSGTIAVMRNQRKIYEQNKLIQRALETMSAASIDRSHLLWITDENIAERPADLNFFNFAVELLSGANTTFSYLAYGELPNWSSINEALMKRNGNSYYADDTEEILEKLDRDLGFFERPAVEDILVTINLSRPVIENATYYPSNYYGTLTSFYPSFNNGRPRTSHFLGGMNYGEIKRFIHYVSLPAYLDLIEYSEPTPFIEGRTLKVGRIYVQYYLPMEDKWVYLDRDLEVEYVSSDSAADIKNNEYVELDTIIQNTPLIMLEAATLANSSRNYLLALKLLQAQISLLEEYGPARPDVAIDEDIETLQRYYDIVFEQAKAVNLLE